MIAHISYSGLRKSPLPNDFAFLDTWKAGEPHEPVHITVPPQGYATGIELRIPKNEPTFVYVWGWARYNDVFPNTPEHIVRFCTGKNSQVWDPKKLFAYTGDSCTRFDCIDDECKK
jgi:hypothetical protein